MNFKLKVFPDSKLEMIIKLIILIAIIISVIALSFIVFNIYKANKNAIQFKQAENFIHQKKWDEAATLLNNVKSYLDSNTLILYVNAQQILKSDNKNYSPVIAKLQQIPLYYQGDFAEDIKKFKDELNLAVQEEARQKQIAILKVEQDKIDSIIQESIILLNSNNYDSAIEKLETKQYVDIPTIKNLNAYAKARKAVSS